MHLDCKRTPPGDNLTVRNNFGSRENKDAIFSSHPDGLALRLQTELPFRDVTLCTSSIHRKLHHQIWHVGNLHAKVSKVAVLHSRNKKFAQSRVPVSRVMPKILNDFYRSILKLTRNIKRIENLICAGLAAAVKKHCVFGETGEYLR